MNATPSPIRTLVAAAAFASLASAAFAQTAPPTGAQTPWMFSSETGYGYGADGKMTPLKMGTSNAKELFKGAKKVPRNTLFFIGENGQLYMRSGPYLEGDGKFRFGPG